MTQCFWSMLHAHMSVPGTFHTALPPRLMCEHTIYTSPHESIALWKFTGPHNTSRDLLLSTWQFHLCSPQGCALSAVPSLLLTIVQLTLLYAEFSKSIRYISRSPTDNISCELYLSETLFPSTSHWIDESIARLCVCPVQCDTVTRTSWAHICMQSYELNQVRRSISKSVSEVLTLIQSGSMQMEWSTCGLCQFRLRSFSIITSSV